MAPWRRGDAAAGDFGSRDCALVSLARSAAVLCDAPWAYVACPCEGSLHVLATSGFEATGTPASGSFAAEVVANGALLSRVGPEARGFAEPWFGGGAKMWVGVPFGAASGGASCAALCIADSRARAPSDVEARALAELARVAASLHERQAELREGQWLRMLFQSSPDGIIAVDAAGRIRRVNPATCRMFGYEEAELLGSPLDLLIPSSSRARHDALVSHYFGEPRHRPMGERDLEGRRKDGSLVPLDIMLGHAGGTAVAFARDITDRKKAAEALRAAEERARRAEKAEAIGEFAACVAHDLNNALCAVTGVTECMLAEGVAEALRADLEIIDTASKQAMALGHQLLSVARRQVLRRQPLDLNVLLRGMTNMLRRLLGPKTELREELTALAPRVLVDRSDMERTIVNLVVNASDAMPSGGVVTIKTANVRLDEDGAREAGVAPGSYVVLSVTDTGPGMDARTRERIFEPYFTTKGSGRGTGLGLASVAGAVRQSDGHVVVDSAIGCGTTFTIYLPVPEDGRAASTPPPREAAANTETVLLVDDGKLPSRPPRER